MKPVTDSLLNRFGADYEASAERHLATLALSKSELSSVAFSSKGANAMRQKFSVEVPTLDVTNQKPAAAAGSLRRPTFCASGSPGAQPRKF